MKFTPLNTELYQYVLKHVHSLHPVLEELRVLTSQMTGAQMQVSHEQACFLNMLVKVMNAQRVLEIGCFTGYSAISMALGLGANGKLVTHDVDPNTASIAQKFFQKAGVAEKIEFELGDARPKLKQRMINIESGKENHFDLAFIDADKSSYQQYFEDCLRLVRPGGLIVVDNVLWDGAVLNQKDQSASTVAIRAFNEFVMGCSKVEACMLPIADGISLLRIKE